MALSFSEKRGLQKEVQTCLASLGDKPDFKAKRSLQKQLAEALAKLGAETGKTESLVDQFLANKFVHEAPNKFFSIFTKVYGLVQGQLENIKQPIIDYIKSNESLMILESALSNDNPIMNLDMRRDIQSTEALQAILSKIATAGKGTITINIG